MVGFSGPLRAICMHGDWSMGDTVRVNPYEIAGTTSLKCPVGSGASPQPDFTELLRVLNGATVTDVARRYGVARQTLHDWLRRYARNGMAALSDRSSKPAICSHQMPPREASKTLQLDVPWADSTRRCRHQARHAPQDSSGLQAVTNPPCGPLPRPSLPPTSSARCSIASRCSGSKTNSECLRQQVRSPERFGSRPTPLRGERPYRRPTAGPRTPHILYAKPASRARRTASVRSATASLVKTFERDCARSSAARPGAVRSRNWASPATRPSTSRSRSGSSGKSAAGVVGAGEEGEHAVGEPGTKDRVAAGNGLHGPHEVGGIAPLQHVPRAPERSAANMDSSSSDVLTTSTATCGDASTQESDGLDAVQAGHCELPPNDVSGWRAATTSSAQVRDSSPKLVPVSSRHRAGKLTTWGQCHSRSWRFRRSPRPTRPRRSAAGRSSAVAGPEWCAGRSWRCGGPSERNTCSQGDEPQRLGASRSLKRIASLGGRRASVTEAKARRPEGRPIGGKGSHQRHGEGGGFRPWRFEDFSMGRR